MTDALHSRLASALGALVISGALLSPYGFAHTTRSIASLAIERPAAWVGARLGTESEPSGAARMAVARVGVPA